MSFRTTIYVTTKAEMALKRLQKVTGRGASSLLAEAVQRAEDNILREHKKLEKFAVTFRKRVNAAIRAEKKKRRKKS